MPHAKFFEDIGMWWPTWESDERRLKDHGYMVRHRVDADPAIALCKQRRTVVQAGGHCGVWPLYLADKFAQVMTFEPAPASYQSLIENVRGHRNITASNYGLSHKVQHLPFDLTYSAGRSRIGKGGTLTIEVRPLDELDLQDVDALFLDIEGHELQALAGAAETITRCRPVIHVEAWVQRAEQLRLRLHRMGYKPAGTICKDEYYVFAGK